MISMKVERSNQRLVEVVVKEDRQKKSCVRRGASRRFESLSFPAGRSFLFTCLYSFTLNQESSVSEFPVEPARAIQDISR